MLSGIISLTQRSPVVAADQMLSSLVPPQQFAQASFANYVADPAFASQETAKARLIEFCAPDPAKKRFPWFSGVKSAQTSGIYLDGGFGVGKTHLLAASYHAFGGDKKIFASFIEITSLVGAIGFTNSVAALRDYRLICIDEFELDDPGDTMVMNRLLGELVKTGTKVIATSNTPANALGEGRFAAVDFLREIQALAAIFEAVRIDGDDYRQRDLSQGAVMLNAVDLDGRISDLATESLLSFDDFDELLLHLSSVHPSRYEALLNGLGAVGISRVHVLEDQAQALRFVAFIDRLYDAQLPLLASGVALQDIFPKWMLDGGYRKKYLRAISRMVALSACPYET